MIESKCKTCGGFRWVCEFHPWKPWNTEDPNGCECGAGKPCKCNPSAKMPPGVEVIASVSPSTVEKWSH